MRVNINRQWQTAEWNAFPANNAKPLFCGHLNDNLVVGWIGGASAEAGGLEMLRRGERYLRAGVQGVRLARVARAGLGEKRGRRVVRVGRGGVCFRPL